MTICHVYADVGPRRPNGFPRHQQSEIGDEIMGADVEWMLQIIHMKFVKLMQRVPMA